MKTRFMGKYSGDPSSLPKKEMARNAHRIRKIDNLSVLAIVMTLFMCVLGYLFLFVLVDVFGADLLSIGGITAALLALLFLVPHEYLHAACFKEESYIYIGNGILFAMSPEHMTKIRYLIMVLLPVTVLGFLPFTAGMLFRFPPLAIFGAVSILPSVGDLYLALNALFQVPPKAKIYLYDMVNYWYIETDSSD